MKKEFLVLLFIVFTQILYSQSSGNEKISLSFDNKNRITVIEQIEDLTNYQFYFIENWFDDTLISGNYINIDIKKLLDTILGETVINYYITKDYKIILTQNSFIIDSLPKEIFRSNNNDVVEVPDNEPILYNEEFSKKGNGNKTIRIGKENSRSKQRKYTLTGFVKNSTTGEPISNLALIISEKKINTVTNNKGFYSINIPSGVNYIETKALGIENSTRKIIIYNNGNLNFSLKESSEILDEVVIEADKDKNLKEAITGITRIKIQEIKNIPLILGERDILQVATSLPGISKTGEGSSGYNVRGGKEDQNLILLDNGVIYNPTHFFGIFSALNPFTSGNVDIFKGNIPAEYGGRLSSVFNITTKGGNTEKFSGEASIGPVTSNVTLELPVIKNKASLLVGARGTYSDWILRSLDDESLKNSKASFFDVILKYNHEINKNNKLKATGYISQDAFSITSDSLFQYKNRLLSINWEHDFNEKNILNLSIANSQYDFDIEFDGDINNDFDLGYKVNETEVKLKMKYNYSDKHKFNYGISSKLYSISPGSILPKGSESIVEPVRIPKEQALESALFISDDFNINDKLLLGLGVRYSIFSALGTSSQRVFLDGLPRNEGSVLDTLNFDKNEIIKTYAGPEFRASARYSLSPSLSVKAGFNTTYQYIHTLSTNTSVSPTDTWKLSDLNIKPQQAAQYTLGFYKNLEESMYELSLEGYYKRTQNILDYKVGADLLINPSIETEVLQGVGKSYGVEFLIKKTKGKFNGWLGYTYSRSMIKFDSDFSEERINNGEFFPSNFDKPHDISLVTNYKITKRFSFSANFAYQTGRPVTFPVGRFVFNGSEQVLFSNRNEFRIPDYYRFDVGFNIEGNHKIKKFAHSFWNISIYNVLGRNNPYSVFFTTDNGEVKAFQSSIFSIPVPTITYNFRF